MYGQNVLLVNGGTGATATTTTAAVTVKQTQYAA
jgi:hypothetical protein